MKVLETLNVRASLDLNRPVLLSPHRTARSWDRNGWVKRKPRFHLPAVSCRSSWDNLNRDWCGHITSARIRRNVYRRVAELRTVLEELHAPENGHRLRFDWPEIKPSNRCRSRHPGIPAGRANFFLAISHENSLTVPHREAPGPLVLLHCSVLRTGRCQSEDGTC